MRVHLALRMSVVRLVEVGRHYHRHLPAATRRASVWRRVRGGAFAASWPTLLLSSPRKLDAADSARHIITLAASTADAAIAVTRYSEVAPGPAVTHRRASTLSPTACRTPPL